MQIYRYDSLIWNPLLSGSSCLFSWSLRLSFEKKSVCLHVCQHVYFTLVRSTGRHYIFMKLPNYENGTWVNGGMKESVPAMASKLPSETSYNLNAWRARMCVCVCVCVCVCACLCLRMVTLDARTESRQREREIRADLQWITSLAGQTCREASCLATVLTEEKDKEGWKKRAGKITGGRVSGSAEARNKRDWV